MKKYFFVSLIAVLSACSSSGDSSEPTGKLIKKIVESFEGGETTTTTYQYNGSKLSTAFSQENDLKIVYSYSGDLITDISLRNLANNESVHRKFVYDSSGRLTHSSNSYPGSDNDDYADYTYNEDGTISAVEHYWDSFELEYGIQTIKYFISEGDIVKIEKYFQSGTQTSTYSYDAKHNPYSNVKGFNKLVDFYLTPHNMISGMVTSSDGSIFLQTNSTYVYDDGDYPTTSVQTGTGNTKTTEYFYN
ncbi:MAG: hypothetical protein EOO48_09740 [Flavobacterium sp.]|nr:MAG: hypothetical protein EOO48_09740 [Flavobacterium sp.]